MLTGFEIILLVFSGIVGGGVNAIAGGGTFFTFPVLIATGLDPLTANVTNAVAIYPGHAAAVPAYRDKLRSAGRSLLSRCVIAASGGLIGAALLLWAGGATFNTLVPFLVFAATLLFTFGPAIRNLAEKVSLQSQALTNTIEFLFAVYGGYFGAGLGVLLMAALTIVGIRDVQMANAQKNLLATIIITISILIFIAAGAVAWPQAICVLIGAVIGGYVGARFARKIPASVLRSVVIMIGFGLSFYYYFKL